MDVKITMLREDAIMPFRGHSIDVGLDCPVPDAGVLKPGANKIPLGWAIEIPVGYTGVMYPRSGMASGEKSKEMLLAGSEETTVEQIIENGVAIVAEQPPIDPGYTGEVHAIITNHSGVPIQYDRGTRFSQLVVHSIVYANLVKNIDTGRKSAGFGSTGT